MTKSNNMRREEIKKYILVKEYVKVDELAKLLCVSAETIRSDLTFLEQTGLLHRTHGGATLRNSKIELPMDIRIQENSMEKKEIAYKAINFIHDDDVIYFDPSSSALPLARLLVLKKNLTIITNSYELIPIAAQSNHKIFVVGGEYSCNGKRMTGGFALETIKSFYFDIAIFGMDGCKNLDGPATMSRDEIFMNSYVLKRTKKAMLLSVSTKFDRVANYQYGNFNEFDIFISDTLTKTQKETLSSIETIVEAMRVEEI